MRVGRLVIVPFVLLAAGCFQGQRTFKVNADGSGTIVDTVKLGEQAKGMMQAMEEMDKSTPAQKKAKRDSQYKEKAGTMGEGVTFVSTEPTPDGGQKITYAFKDVTRLKASAMPSPDENTASKDEPLVFKMSKSAAGNTVLTIVSPKPNPSEAKAPKPAAPKPEEMAQQIQMMKTMMAGLKVKSVVEVSGKLVKTSSPHSAGSAVTLMELDFDQLDAAGLQKLAASGKEQPSPEQLRGLKGIKVSDPEVTIEFAGK